MAIFRLYRTYDNNNNNNKLYSPKLVKNMRIEKENFKKIML